MRRLYLQIYLAFVAVVTLTILGAAFVSALVFGRPLRQAVGETAALAAAVAELDPSDPDLQGEVEELARDWSQDVTVYGADGAVLATTAPRVDAFSVEVRLTDGRRLVLGRATDRTRARQSGTWMCLVAAGIAVGCLPIARRITKRLERVASAMRRWGTGALDVRAPVDGRDEVADVARAFNDAASRVQELFDAQRRVLASASHELRSPLARLRMALELVEVGEAQRPVVEGAVRDVEELDATVGDLLQAGRLQAVDGLTDPADVDLGALAAEEAARVGASASGPGWVVPGDPRLLRRLVRNLLENAARHAGGPIEVAVGPGRLEVLDRGSGVPEDLRERIFEPFFRPAGHAEGRDGGVGLGLFLVAQIARHHGARATVEPRDGGGSRFVVAWVSDPRRIPPRRPTSG